MTIGTRRLRLLAAVASCGVVMASCAVVQSDARADVGQDATVTTVASVGESSTIAEPKTPQRVESHTLAPNSTTTTTTTRREARTFCPSIPEAETQGAPESIRAALAPYAAALDADGLDTSVSIWIEGLGEVLEMNPEMQLAPASNQKLLVAIGANAMLVPTARFETTLEHSGDELILRPGGDPTLTTAALDEMAAEVRNEGVGRVETLIIDLREYPQAPRASGWLDWQIPTYVGPLSGLMVDDNRWSTSEQFVKTPGLVNGERMAERLRSAGVAVANVESGARPEGVVLARRSSEPISALVSAMLLQSDNQHGDLLLMELGRVDSGAGTLDAGADAIDRVLTERCLPASGRTDDGSGLSRGNRRSAREIQEILRGLDEDSRSLLRSQLPVGGVSGTLSSRFLGSNGRVQAKTGTIIGGRSLSGYAVTNGGREVVFSILVNGDPDRSAASITAIDNLVEAVLAFDE